MYRRSGPLLSKIVRSKRKARWQVASRADKLQAALGDLFGIRPRIESVTREAHAGATEPAATAFVEEAEEPSEEEALKRLKDVLGAIPADESDDPED